MPKALDETIPLARIERPADAKLPNRLVHDDDLAFVVAVESLHRLGERRAVEPKVWGSTR
jgi:hypothetical protein